MSQATRYAGEPLSPETGLALSLKQALFIIGALLVAGSGWAYLVMGQAATSKDVTDIKAAQTTITATATAALNAQEEKRAALGREFLASNEKIAAKVGELATAIAVQQNQQKATDEKLSKVLDQLGMVLQQTPRRPSPSGNLP